MASRRWNTEDVAVLAAAQAALDPDRRKWRNDILISSIIEILASQGPLNLRQLHLKVSSLWLTNAVDRGTIRTALAWAEEENLIEKRPRGKDTCWAATPSSAEEIQLDKKSAMATLATFEQDVRRKLDVLCEGKESISESRARDLAGCLVGAFMAGTERVFEGVLNSANPSKIDAIYFDQDAVAAYVREHANPLSMQKNLTALARTAFDPTDPFGTEILHLLVTGKVLQGMMARRDLPGATPVQESTLLLDTSVLIYRISPGGPHPQLLEDLIQASQQAGWTVIVTRAVLREWASVWRAADREAQTLENSATGIPLQSWRFERNAAVRYWQWVSDSGRPQKWLDFKRNHGQIEAWLTEHQVRIIEDGQANPDVVEQVRRELMRLAEATKKQVRTPTTARTDAYSAALVAETRQRTPAPIPRSWFIAQDRLTNRAYSAIWPSDSFPLAATVEAWLLLLSVTRGYDRAETINLAEIMGEAMIRNSFLSVSANYTTDDLVDLVKDLKKESRADEEQVADQFCTEFFAQADGEVGDFSAALARHRAMRRNRQLAAKQEQVRAMELNLASVVEDATNRQLEESEKVAQLEVKSTRWQHGCYLVIGLALTGLGIVLSAFLGASIVVDIVATAGWIACGVEGIRWLRKTPAVSAVGFVLCLIATIAWTVVASLLSAAIAQPTPTHPTPARTPPSASASTAGRAAA